MIRLITCEFKTRQSIETREAYESDSKRATDINVTDGRKEAVDLARTEEPRTVADDCKSFDIEIDPVAMQIFFSPTLGRILCNVHPHRLFVFIFPVEPLR